MGTTTLRRLVRLIENRFRDAALSQGLFVSFQDYFNMLLAGGVDKLWDEGLGWGFVAVFPYLLSLLVLQIKTSKGVFSSSMSIWKLVGLGGWFARA